ncbi:MAG: nuclear transport factor 2 family protein [Pyrinomonadaceae bacterium]
MVKIIVIILVLVFLIFLAPYKLLGQSASNAVAQPVKSSLAEVEVLRREEEGRLRVLKGETNWDDMMADGAYLIQFDGSVMTYKAGIALPSFPVKSFVITEMIARQVGQSVIVTGLAELSGTAPDKREFTFQTRYLNVWRKKKNGRGWEIMVSTHTTVKDSVKAVGSRR